MLLGKSTKRIIVTLMISQLFTLARPVWAQNGATSGTEIQDRIAELAQRIEAAPLEAKIEEVLGDVEVAEAIALLQALVASGAIPEQGQARIQRLAEQLRQKAGTNPTVRDLLERATYEQAALGFWILIGGTIAAALGLRYLLLDKACDRDREAWTGSSNGNGIGCVRSGKFL